MTAGDYVLMAVMLIFFTGLGYLLVDIEMNTQDINKNIRCEVFRVNTSEGIPIEITGCHRTDKDQDRWWIATKNVDHLIIEK